MFLFLEEGCCEVDMALHTAALFALKKYEVALYAFDCVLIDYSSLERSETLAEAEALFETLAGVRSAA